MTASPQWPLYLSRFVPKNVILRTWRGDDVIFTTFSFVIMMVMMMGKSTKNKKITTTTSNKKAITDYNYLVEPIYNGMSYALSTHSSSIFTQKYISRYLAIVLSKTMLIKYLLISASVTRLGEFESSLCETLLQKNTKYLESFWALLKRVTFKVKTAVATFWASFGEIWANFYSNIWLHWCLPIKMCQSTSKKYSQDKVSKSQKMSLSWKLHLCALSNDWLDYLGKLKWANPASF